jgi:hypothetical protein
MKKHSHLKEIIITLASHGVDFIICGGVALVLHGVERFTMDLDLSVDLNEKNIGKFLKAMNFLGLTPRAPVPAESMLDPEKRKMMVDEKNALVFTFIDKKNPYRQVDVFITDAISYNTLIDSVTTIPIENYQIQVLTKKKLLDLKKKINPPRDKDIFDIMLLEKILRKQKED